MAAFRNLNIKNEEMKMKEKEIKNLKELVKKKIEELIKIKEKCKRAIELMNEEINKINNLLENVYKLKEEKIHRKELQEVTRPEKKRKTSGNEGYDNLTADELRKNRGQSTPRRSEISKDGNNRSGGEVEKLTPIQVDNVSAIKDK